MLMTRCRNPFTGSGHSFLNQFSEQGTLREMSRNPFTGSGHSFFLADKIGENIAEKLS